MTEQDDDELGKWSLKSFQQDLIKDDVKLIQIVLVVLASIAFSFFLVNLLW